MEKSTTNPMPDFLKEALQNAKRKHLKETFNYLDSINSPKNFIIKSEYPTANKVPIHISKGKRCYEFSTDSLNIVKDFQSYQKDGWGFRTSIKLIGNGDKWKIPNGVASISLLIGKNMITKGKIWEIEDSFDIINATKFFRLVLPLNSKQKKNHWDSIRGERFVVGESLRMGGLTEFKCGLNEFHLFDYHNGNESYLFIDSLSRMKYSDFEKSIGAIIYSLGFLSGYLPRSEMYILQSDEQEFLKIIGFQYRRIENTVTSEMEVISSDLQVQLLKRKRDEVRVDVEVFSKLTTKAKEDIRFLRALRTIAEANNYPLTTRASCYTVALETVKSIIIEENEDKVNPFKTKKQAKEIIGVLKESLSSFEDHYFNNKAAIVNKIEQLNQVTNKDSFKIAFELCGINLTEDDENTLLMRNDFLHGRVPFENENGENQIWELQFITYKLHFLLSALIMKYCGYTGILLNKPLYFSILTQKKMKIVEPLFRKI